MRSFKRIVAGGMLLASVVVVPGVAAAAGPLDGLTVPPPDPALLFVAPTPDQANYEARLNAFVDVTVHDTWNGQEVQFLSTFDDNGGVEVLGLPTSAPKADPNNPNFIYQRFQNGVLFFNGSEGTTSVIALQ